MLRLVLEGGIIGEDSDPPGGVTVMVNEVTPTSSVAVPEIFTKLVVMFVVGEQVGTAGPGKKAVATFLLDGAKVRKPLLSQFIGAELMMRGTWVSDGACWQEMRPESWTVVMPVPFATAVLGIIA